MKFVCLLGVFLLIVPLSYSSWIEYQNDLRNTGVSIETGYFPIKTSNFSSELGMNFQPLADDLDSDGKTEIVIFANATLMIFNPQLEIISQINVGSILGQPVLYNLENNSLNEIVFNARQNATDYFFAYQYNNSNLSQEFNITLSNNANFSGIKCFKFNGTDYCTFKDKLNYVHAVNMELRTDDYYFTSNYEERRQTVPAAGDIDNDGNLDIVFWFNEDNSSGYGLLAFDFGSRSVKWTVDNIFSPLILGPSLFHQLFELKGQPVLVDLNNDNLLEIAVSVFYDDSSNFNSKTDLFTELHVYSHNGTKLFSKCEAPTVINSGCNDGLSGQGRWEGTNPFVIDYDGNGVDDICFIKDVKRSIGAIGFHYMALNCYNYSGTEIAKVNLSGIEDGIRGTAMAADMDGDGVKEIVTMRDIYFLNGTSIFSYGLTYMHPIAVDLDGNKGLDLIWTRNGETRVFLDNANYSVDLAVYDPDISFLNFNSTHVNISALIRNTGQIEAENVKVALYNAETLDSNTAQINIKKGKNFTFSSIIALKPYDNIFASVDYNNEINESNEGNNDVLKQYIGLPYVYVENRQEEYNVISYLDSTISDYIRDNLKSGYYTDNSLKADVIVNIGKNNPSNRNNAPSLASNFGYGYDLGSIIFNDEIGVNPYSAIVASYTDSGILGDKTRIMIAGNDIDGDIAGIKEFIRNQALFLGTSNNAAVFIDDEDVSAVKVYDYLHLESNKNDYKQNNEIFKNIVEHALNDTMFTEINYNVTTTNNSGLRIRNLKSELSNDYRIYLNSTNNIFMPVVMSGGIWADISAWQQLGGELSSNGRDVWLIEVTGGPETECESCYNYEYGDLVDDFWPALIGGVQSLSGNDKIQYVAHSNGCRTALDSLSNWTSTGKPNAGKVINNGSEITVSMSSDPVDIFVGVACPGNFSELSYFARQVRDSGEVAIQRLQNKGNLHPKFGDVSHELESSLGEVAGISRFFDNPRISLNLFGQYYRWISGNDDEQPGDGLEFDRFTIIGGKFIVNNDLIVPLSDEDAIFDKVTSNDKTKFVVNTIHVGMAEDNQVKNYVKESLNKN